MATISEPQRNKRNDASPPPDAARAWQALSPTRKDYSRIAPCYDETRYLSRKANFTYSCERDLLRNTLARHAHSRRLLIDIACGTGHFTHPVRPLFHRVLGVDLTLAMLIRAKTKGGPDTSGAISFIQASADELPLAENAADVVMTTRFLHLFPRERHREILSRLVPIIRPGGLLVVEHDSPFLEHLAHLWGVLRLHHKRCWSSYSSAERPAGTELVARIGVSAPGLPTLSLVWLSAAKWLSRLFIHSPFNRMATFVIVVYRRV